MSCVCLHTEVAVALHMTSPCVSPNVCTQPVYPTFTWFISFVSVMASEGYVSDMMDTPTDWETESQWSPSDGEADASSNSSSSNAMSYTESLAETIPSTEEDSDSSEDEPESAGKFSERIAHLFRQMMFVSGETAEASVETTTIIEDIVRQQVIEIVCYFKELFCCFLTKM